MKKLYRHKFIILVIIYVFISSILLYYVYTKSVNAQINNSFSNLLISHNITVAGPDSNLSDFQIKGFIDMIDSENDFVVKKYNKRLSTEENMISLTASEILELHYYSIPPNEQDNIIMGASNQKVDVSMANNSILISYNTK